MNKEELEEILDELNSVRPELLNDNAQRLFTVIMKIADERDELQKELDKKDKVIDLMTEYLNENNREFWTDDIEETKQYFYKKVSE